MHLPRSAPRLAAGLLLPVLLASPALGQSFQDVTAACGITGVPFSTVDFGSGHCCGDFDGDGDLDAIIAGSSGTAIFFFRNVGNMTFVDATAGCGLGLANDVHAMTPADVDNDGDLDLFVCNWRTPSQLFINDGAGHFTQEAKLRGITGATSCFSASFGDYDRDGWLDLYLGNRLDPNTSSGQANILYRNTGGGHFVDVTASTGTGHTGWTFIATFMDYDEDGWPDIVCVNDRGLSQQPNEILRNNGNGTFTPVGALVHANNPIDGMGVDFTDVFNDGGVDFYCSDSPVDHVFNVWDPAQRRYFDRAYTYGLQGGYIGWAANWFDYDNDGWQDLQVVHMSTPNHVYRNPGQPAAAQAPWPEVGVSLGLDQPWEQTATVLGDFDDDGGIDVLHRYPLTLVVQAPISVTMHRNNVVRGNWLKFRTRGTVSNRDGIGARIEVFANGLHQRQWVKSGVGFMGGSDMRVHFGLGGATQAERVVVTWPSGQVQFLTDVPANQIVLVEEPKFDLRGPAVMGTLTHLDLSVPGEAGLAYSMALAWNPAPATLLPDGRTIPIRYDEMSEYTIVPGNLLLPNSGGVLDGQGRATSPLRIPWFPPLLGHRISATAVTFDIQHFPLVRTVFPRAVTFTVQ